MLLGALCLSLDNHGIYIDHFYGHDHRFVGTIIKTGENKYGQTLTVALDSVNAGKNDSFIETNGNIIVNLFEFETGFRPFDIIVFSSKLEPLVNRRDLPDDPDFSNYYFTHNITAHGYVEPSHITVTGKSNSIKARLWDLHEHVSEIIDDSGVSVETATLLNALLLGDEDSLSADEREIFADSGLAHILALSGTHVAIVSAFVFILLLPLRLLRVRYSIFLATIVFMWFYAALTGLSPSVTRSVIMLTVLFLARMSSRASNSLNSLCLAGLLIIVFQPRALFAPSFQLSFCAVASILLFAEALRQGRHERQWRHRILDYLMVTVSALLGTGLLSAYYFHKLPVYSLIANLPAILFLPVILIGCISMVILGLAGIQFAWLPWGLDVLCQALQDTASYISSLPGAVIKGIYFHPSAFIPYILAIVALAFLIAKRERFWGYTSALCFLVSIALVVPAQSDAQNNYYIIGNSKGTEIIIHKGHEAFYYTTRTNEIEESVQERLNREHPDFLAKRGIVTFQPLKPDISGNEPLYGNQTVTIGSSRILIINDSLTLSHTMASNSPTYAIVNCKLSHRQLEGLYQRQNVDTLIFPRQLHLNYARNYMTYLDSIGLPYISLREENFWRSN